MNMSPWQSPRPLRAGIAAILVALAGCASIGDQTPEQQVERRAAAYWKARASADLKTAYSLLTPAYRGINSEEQFGRQFGTGAALTDTGVEKVTCEAEDRCTARIRITAKPAVPGLSLPKVTTYIDETWLQQGQQWWRFEEP
uniref:hypothetical protein n=1 Tax=Acidovorax sp. TaxID=1872122 RepID=UPI002639604D|nr:hypothetical protein [Acidovorax sp.]